MNVVIGAALMVAGVVAGSGPARVAVGPDKPATAVVRAPAAVRQALAQPGDDLVRLTVRKLAAAGAADFAVRVFLNTPGAAADTARTEPGYVASFAFSHDPAVECDFTFDPAPALKRLVAAKQFDPRRRPTVTLVLVPLRAGVELPADAKVTFQGADLALVDPAE